MYIGSAARRGGLLKMMFCSRTEHTCRLPSGAARSVYFTVVAHAVFSVLVRW